MQYIFKVILLSTMYYLADAFKQPLNLPILSRKHFCKLIGASVMHVPRMVLAEEENRPLTPEEMEEYNRLLKEAEKIKSIIDANKRSLLDDDNENGIKKYLDEKRNKENVK
jgi:hypothetical protein